MKGLEISEKYFEEYGAAIEEKVPEAAGKLCYGLAGSGSECFGYDDELSRDHDFDPGFVIFVPDGLDSRVEFRLERAYASLPKEFMGLKRQPLSPVGGNRRGVVKTSEFFTARLGCYGPYDARRLLSVPESYLAEAVNGKIFRDELGEVTALRESIENMPRDVRLKRLAGRLITMAQAGQYNYGRCYERGETGAAQLAAIRFAENAMGAVFAINSKYMPFYKWAFRAMRELPALSQTAEAIEFLLSSPNDADTYPAKQAAIAEVSEAVIAALKEENLTDAVCGDLEKHAYSVNDRIADPSIRNESVFFAV